MRFVSYPDFAEITKSKPEKSLVEGLKKSGGRNAHGRKTSRHRGGGAKRALPADRLQAPQGRRPGARSPRSSTTPTAPPTSRCCTTPTARSATSSRPQRLTVGMTVPSGDGRRHRASATAWRSRDMPVGTVVHNIELQPGRGGQMARSAGASAQLMAKDGDMATLRLPSGEMRMVRAECRATVGVIGNAEHQNVKVGKAGRKRHMGVRPQTRGVAMNPVDHPHGGGEGSTSRRPPPGDAVGRADARLPHAQARTRPPSRYIVRGRKKSRDTGKELTRLSRSSKKGPLVEERLMARSRR